MRPKGWKPRSSSSPDTCAVPNGRHDPALFPLDDVAGDGNLLAWSPRTDADAARVAAARARVRDPRRRGAQPAALCRHDAGRGNGSISRDSAARRVRATAAGTSMIEAAELPLEPAPGTLGRRRLRASAAGSTTDQGAAGFGGHPAIRRSAPRTPGLAPPASARRRGARGAAGAALEPARRRRSGGSCRLALHRPARQHGAARSRGSRTADATGCCSTCRTSNPLGGTTPRCVSSASRARRSSPSVARRSPGRPWRCSTIRRSSRCSGRSPARKSR